MALGLGRVDVTITDCGQCVQGLIVVTHRQVPTVHHLVSPDSFRTLGLQLRAGRGIMASDTGSARRIAVVGASLARRHFEGGHAVGRSIRIGREAGAWYTVVGIAEDRDVAGFGGGGQPPFVVYLSIAQHPPRAAELLLRGEVGARIAGEQRAVPDSPPATLSELRAAQAAPERWFAWLIRLEGWGALAAATLGTFAVMRLWVHSRVTELAVRRAFGARRVQVLGFIALRVLGVTGGGVAIAWWLAPIAAEAAARVIPGLPAWDATGVIVPVVVLAGATAAAGLGPAWRVATAPPGALLGGTGP
jgi:putative ABC transport system permease protein